MRKAWLEMLFYIYGVVAVLCLIAFRSWRAVHGCAAAAGADLDPVRGTDGGARHRRQGRDAAGDRARRRHRRGLRAVPAVGAAARPAPGLSLPDAYRAALAFTGRIVALVGFTLAAGVITWALSPIKFQADMGILLAFMFLWNMLGALILIPSLSYFLLPTSAVRTPHKLSQTGVPHAA